jgi:hypothetical protein
MKCRLRQNVIVDGKFKEPDSVIDDAILPPHLKDATHVSYDLTDTGGRAMLLRENELYQCASEPRRNTDNYPRDAGRR